MITKSLILAAGKGTRMKSDLPKVLHTVNGIPMVMHVIHAVQKATREKPVLVVGYKADQVKNAVGPHADYVVQTEQLGTAHAVQTGEPALKNSCDLVFVTYGDMPLLRVTTIQKLIEAQTNHTGPFTMLTAVANDPRGFGRVIRDEAGNVQAIVEEAVATPEILAVKELNTGVYCFNNSWLWENIKKVTLSPKGEYYLTDLVEIAVRQGNSVQALVANDINEVIGVNTLEHLADAEHALNLRAQEGK